MEPMKQLSTGYLEERLSCIRAGTASAATIAMEPIYEKELRARGKELTGALIFCAVLILITFGLGFVIGETYDEPETYSSSGYRFTLPPVSGNTHSPGNILSNMTVAPVDDIDLYVYEKHPDGSWALDLIDWASAGVTTRVCQYNFHGVGTFRWYANDDGGCDVMDGYRKHPDMPRVIPDTA